MGQFKPLLADPPEPKWPLRFPFLASPKYDGIRCICHQDFGPVTRKLKDIPNVGLRAMLSAESLIHLDGELLAGPPSAKDAMQRTTSAVMSHHGSWADVKFYVFDHVEQPDWHYTARLNLTVNAFRIAQSTGLPIVLVEQKLVRNEEELGQYEESILAQGYEGVIIRSLDGKYKFGRSTPKEQIMLKLKRFKDTEGEVVAFFEQEENTNELQRDELGHAKRSTHQAGKVGKGTLGGFIVRLGPEWECATVRVGTGQGWTNDFRQYVWDNKEQFLGQTLKYKYQECGSKDRPRLPIGLGFRDERDMGDL